MTDQGTPSSTRPESLRSRLSHPLSSFVGRKRELTEVKALLAHTRLLTLTGVGGCGKTRLAQQVAVEVDEAFEHGVYWAELAALSDPALVPQWVATVLGVREVLDEPLEQTVARTVQDRHLLLVLDNCEHVLSTCAQLAEALLYTCPNLQVLATSREPLGLVGEHAWLVPSLSMPDPAELQSEAPELLSDLAQYDAVQLFIERATSVRASFTLTEENAAAVVQVCRRLDGMPLALELAAARVRVLAVRQIAARLDDRFNLLAGSNRTAMLARHQTLRAAMDWSHQLLAEPEQVLFRRLAVFAGSWTLAAAEAVCVGDGLGQGEVLDVLSALVDKSLAVANVQETEETEATEEPEVTRYHFLETVRQYAWERLRESGEEDRLRRQHAAHYLAWVTTAQPGLVGPQEALWLSWMECEHDNLRAALGWSLDGGDAETGLRLAAALSPFWRAHNHASEGLTWLTRALERHPNGPAPVRVEALRGAGRIASGRGHVALARSLNEQSLALAQTLGDRRGIAAALHELGIVAFSEGDYASARPLFGESLALRRQLEDRQGTAQALNALGELARFQGDSEAAEALYHESLAISRELGDMHGMSLQLANLGYLALRRGAVAHAATLFEESLALARKRGDRTQTALCLAGLAGTTGARGQPALAARLLGAAEALLDRIGVTLDPTDRADVDRIVEAVQAPLGADAFTAARAEGRALKPEQASAEALEARTPPQAAVVAEPELRILGLGPTQVWLSGHALKSSDWTYAKVKELLFFLLVHPPRAKEQIGLALWPDASPARLRGHLSNSLYHLRRALGRPEWIVFENDAYTFSRALGDGSPRYWFDLEVFEFHAAEARRLRDTAPAQAVQHLEQAVDLFRGEFLDDLSQADWVVLQREAVRRKQLEALLLLGRLLFGQARYEHAAEAYRRALAQDSYLEAAHRELMRCYAQLGERGQALRHYQVVVALLRDELGAAPAPETTALFERLRRGEP